MSRQIILDVITSEPLIYYGDDALLYAAEQGDLIGLYLIGDEIYFFTENDIYDQYGNTKVADDIFYKHEDSDGKLEVFPLVFKPE